MPRYSGVFLSLALLSICLGINTARYPAVWNMIANSDFPAFLSQQKESNPPEQVVLSEPSTVPATFPNASVPPSPVAASSSAASRNPSDDYGPIPVQSPSPRNKSNPAVQESYAQHQSNKQGASDYSPQESTDRSAWTRPGSTTADGDPRDNRSVPDGLRKSQPGAAYARQYQEPQSPSPTAPAARDGELKPLPPVEDDEADDDEYGADTGLSSYEMVEAFRQTPLGYDISYDDEIRDPWN